MEELNLLMASGTILAVTMTASIGYLIAIDILQKSFDMHYKRHCKYLKDELDTVRKQLTLWKKACDNLNKELVDGLQENKKS